MENKFYQEIIKKSDEIVAELGCSSVDEALKKLEAS